MLIKPEFAKESIKQITKLHKIEKIDEILVYRKKFSESIVDALFIYLYNQRQRPDILPSNLLSKALSYALERKAELKIFLSNHAVPIDTNHLERALRVITMGKKNNLFCWI